MPLIPRQAKPPARQAINCKVPTETASLLKRYAEFLDSTQEYVVHEILVLAFRRDKEFQEWLVTTGATTPHDGTDVSPEVQPVPRARS